MNDMRIPDDPSSFDDLERGLRAGFDGAHRNSVVAFLERKTGTSLGVSLADLDFERDPVVKSPGETTEAGSRYAVVGEIARGGLGVVLKGRDRDLGRDVAMKVLHERFKDDRQVIERFVEEAQIGGQLQHPGIVPVYEMGLAQDDRPFFAMKLVKGQTLAEKLRRRASPSDGQQAFLRIFHQACQTVAYAHARRVVHRDIKPSNVMVGAFGEVQVVDWGLAKVLRRGGAADDAPTRPSSDADVSVIETVRSAEGSSHSIAGSVMGTPAYMPPEQARGEIALMDERSDVFSLGAVLCEILSGKPPYDPTDASAALRDAAEGRHESALAALDVSGADGELVQLARACLSPACDARPADAGEVAARIEAYLLSVEERARQAEVRAAELRVRARSTVLVAAVVLVSVILAGGTWFARERHRQERLQETRQLADAAIVEANHYAGQAQQAGLGGAGLWALALGSALRASQIVAAGVADPDLEGRVGALVQQLEGRERTTRAEALREESHELLLERLREVRVGPDVIYMDFRKAAERRARESARRDAEYAALFAEVGFDAEDTDVAAVPGLFDCGHGGDFALALDAWAEARRVAAVEGADVAPESWRRLVRSARLLDAEDPWRNALRDELSRAELDVDALGQLVRPEVLRERSAEETALVVALLEAAGDLHGAIEAQLFGISRHPADYWLNLSLVSVCWDNELTGRRYEPAVRRTASVAASLRPESRRARLLSMLEGPVLPGILDDEDVDALARELLRDAAGDEHVIMSLYFGLMMERGRFAEAADLLPGAIDALQKTDSDMEYHEFLVVHGHGDRLLESPFIGGHLVSAIPILLHLGRVDDVWAALEDERDAYRAHGTYWRTDPLWLAARSRDEVVAMRDRLIAMGDASDAELAAVTAEEALAAAEIVEQGWGDLPAAVRLYAAAFERDPASKEDWRFGSRARHEAANRAALASAGVAPGTESLAPHELRELRELALAWLDEELDVIVDQISAPGIDRSQVLRVSMVLHQMQFYGWLAPIREPQYLARMTEAEAHRCRVIWARIHGIHSMLDALLALEE